MEPIISEIDTKKNSLEFVLSNVDVSVPNSIRRVVTSNIPTLVFRGFPENEQTINIQKNTTKFNNEYLKHRIMCIPICNNDMTSFNSYVNNYEIVIDETNDTMEKKYITTEHIKIRDKSVEDKTKFMDEEFTRKLFPSDPKTGDFILICILYPNYNKKNEPNESLALTSHFDIGTAGENSCWNVVSNICYENVQDVEKVKQELDKIDGNEAKKDFEILDAQRISIPKKFKMYIESLGIYQNNELVKQACSYIKDKLGLIMTKINDIGQYDESSILSKEESSMRDIANKAEEDYEPQYCKFYKDDDFIVFVLFNDDYTIGKLIEKYFYENNQKKCSFVGFKKEHPTKKEAYIYIKYNKKSKQDTIYEDFNYTLSQIIKIFTLISESL